MTSVRSAKVKGSAFEYDLWWSLKTAYPNTRLTKQLGFQMQYDVICDDLNIVFECKRLKAISWNHAEDFLLKLEGVAPQNHLSVVAFKSNHQPCLVMYRDLSNGHIQIRRFEDRFNMPFLKHESTRPKKDAVPQ